MSLPLCANCISNFRNNCTQSMPHYPSRYTCIAFISEKGDQKKPEVTSGEFKVYSDVTPTKMIKYALLP